MALSHTTVKSDIHLLARPERAVQLARFFKTAPEQYGEGDQFLGLPMPQQHLLAKQYRQLSLDETERLVQDKYHECRMTGLLIWIYQTRKAALIQQKAILERYLKNRQYINNWDLVDVTSPHILGRHVAQSDRSILYDLAQEAHLWSQRMAIVSTFALIRKEQFSDTLALAEQLISHKHDLIHKAIGWMLREGSRQTQSGCAGRVFTRSRPAYAPHRAPLRHRTLRTRPSALLFILMNK